jgi:LEA14-like dessication related protein
MDSLINDQYYGRGTVKIKNSNTVSITSKFMKFNLFYKNKLITNGESQDNFTLNSREITSVPVRFTILIDSILRYANEIFSQDTIELNSHVKGNFTALNFQLEHKQAIKLSSKEIINGLIASSAKNSFKLLNPKVKTIKLESTELSVDFALKNTFPFDLDIDKADFNVYLKENGKSKVSDWELENKIKLKTNTDTLIKTNILINNIQTGTGMLEKLISKKLDFYLIGTVGINFKNELIKLPIRLHLALNPISGEISSIEE